MYVMEAGLGRRSGVTNPTTHVDYGMLLGDGLGTALLEGINFTADFLKLDQQFDKLTPGQALLTTLNATLHNLSYSRDALLGEVPIVERTAVAGVYTAPDGTKKRYWLNALQTPCNTLTTTDGTVNVEALRKALWNFNRTAYSDEFMNRFEQFICQETGAFQWPDPQLEE